MEKLTMTSPQGGVAFTFDLDVTCEKSEMLKILKLAERLKQYEDTNLTPEQMIQIDKDYSEQAKELHDWKENGIKLPCKVGDTIYVVPSKVNYDLNVLNKHYADNRVYEQVVNEIRIYRSGMFIVTCEGQAGVRDESYKETWFFTREEAEAKLKEMEGK